MARITLAFLVSLVAYFAYYTLTSDAQAIGALALNAGQDTNSPGASVSGSSGSNSGGNNGRLENLPSGRIRRPQGYHERAARLFGHGNQAFTAYRRAERFPPGVTAEQTTGDDERQSLAADGGKGEPRIYFLPAGYRADVPGRSLRNGDDTDDDDEGGDGVFVKRFDDYGHMRFGKRGGEGDQFDDYGHMRFGR